MSDQSPDQNKNQRISSGRSPLEQTLADLADPQIIALGFDLVRVRISGGDNMVVQFIAERPDRTMNVDDCATVSRALSELFDEQDPINGEYTLEVSSPGIARPLTRPKDFEDFKGHLIKVELGEALDGRKRFRGILDGMEDGHVMVAAEGDRNEAGEEMVWGLPFDDIAEARLIMTYELVASATPPASEEDNK